ncbi:MAG: MATE family efflux transporter, partial [Oscillospiraceae bacterium]|nr:MATE family efflux transporter [Oscillospiraceae bacterium]
YFRLYFLGSLATILYNAGMGILQAVGDSRSPLYYLVISSAVNVALDLLFVGAMDMGVAGAAVATVISQVVSAVLCIIKLTRSDGPYRLEIKRIGFDLPLLKKITSQGVPSGVQNSIIAIANVVVQSNINTFGSDAMAGCGSYAKVEGFVFLPITSFAMALTTFTGQNLGAGQYERAKRGARVGFTCSTLLAELIGLTLLLVAPYAIALFNDDPAVIAIGVRQTRTEALFYFALAFAHSISAVMRGAGRAKMPMYTMLVCWCVIRVTYITLALKVWPDITTIFWAYPITWCLSCVVFLLYYLKADWVHSFQKMH